MREINKFIRVSKDKDQYERTVLAPKKLRPIINKREKYPHKIVQENIEEYEEIYGGEGEE